MKPDPANEQHQPRRIRLNTTGTAEFIRKWAGCPGPQIIGLLATSWRACLLHPFALRHVLSCPACKLEYAALRRETSLAAWFRVGLIAWLSGSATIVRTWLQILRSKPAFRVIVIGGGAAAVLCLVAALLTTRHSESDSPPSIAKGSTNSVPPAPNQSDGTGTVPILLASRGATNDAKPRVLVSIGINQYSPETHLPSLQGAVNDANRVADLLADNYLVRRLTPGGHPEAVPTRANILKELSQLPRSVEGGHIVIYWSGHGVGVDGQAYLMPQDASGDPKLSGLTLEQLSEAIASSRLNFQSFVLVLDTCKASAKSPSRDFIKNLNTHAKNWLVISAASEGGLAYERLRPATHELAIPEAREPHGYFTYYLLESRYLTVPEGGVLISPADANRDGIISWGEAFAYAEGELKQLGNVGNAAGGLSQPRQSPQRLGNEDAIVLSTPFLRVETVPTATGNRIGSHQISSPSLDASGRFVLYTDIEDDTVLPFLPEHWMWGNARKDREMAPHLVTQMMQLDLKSETQPEGGRGTCVRWQIIWKGNAKDQTWNATWAGIGWVAGSGDGPPWWATDNRGRYYNLETPRKFQRFHFSARSPRPGTVIKLKLGFLARDKDKKPLPLGDSLAYPIPVDGSANESFALTSSWQHFTVLLEPFVEPHDHDANRDAAGVCQLCGDSAANPKHNNFERFCSLAFIVKKESQPDKDAPVEIYLDNLFFD